MLTRGDFDGFDDFGDADTPAGTATSYVSDELCDINRIRTSGKDLNGQWREYCDCMFLEYVLQDTYYFHGVEEKRPFDLPENAWQAFIKSKASLPNAGFTIRVEKRPVYTQTWSNCMAHFCASPQGCGQPDGRKDPFNANPGMLADPWTEVGSASRGIPMRGGANQDWRWMRDLAAVTVIDMAEYDPVKLWATMWGNPAKLTLLLLKAAVVPFGAPYMLSIAAPHHLVHLAASEIEKRQYLGDNRQWKYLVQPMLHGGINFVGLAIKYLGKCGIGINIPCGIGEVVQQICIDQINDRDANGVSELEKITDPNLQAVVVFLSKHGAVLVQKVVNSISGLKDGTIFAWLETVFKQIATEPLLQKELKWDVKLALNLLSVAAGIANIVYLGYQNKDSIGDIADSIIFKLLGFRPSEVKYRLTKSVADAQATIAEGQAKVAAKGGSATTVTAAIEYMGVVAGALGSLAKVIQDINGKIGGGLEDLVANIKATTAGLSTATGATTEVLNNVQTAVTTGLVIPGGYEPPPEYATTKKSTPASSGAGGGAAVVGFAAGAALGGPMGALVGLGLAMLAGQTAAAPKPVVVTQQKGAPSATPKLLTTNKPLSGYGGRRALRR
ncbi:MAG: hypothetical protein KA310_03530 [Pseudomonadales bacterium]|nr:hypothetical protein [Pseudomonadales bacterium]